MNLALFVASEGGIKGFGRSRVRGRRVREALGLGSFKKAKENNDPETRREEKIGLRSGNQEDWKNMHRVAGLPKAGRLSISRKKT